MKISINSMNQEELGAYLMRVVECAFREGVLYEKCRGEVFVPPLHDAIKSCQINIVVEGNL